MTPPTENPDNLPENDPIDDGIGTYDVVILAEHEVSATDAQQIHSLHEDIKDQVVYHVLIPLDDASARIEASMGALGAGEMLAAPTILSDADVEAVRRDCQERAAEELSVSLAALAATGADTTGTVVDESPLDDLETKVAAVDAREAIILTRPHVVAEFFHVDWTSRARRKIGVPVLHLLEHERFDEQAGGGEGVTGV
ncbi:hypothetical protein [Nocardioides houyundeii]|uniref:hypothetical protein n=1 Tax=Nocardioides houyundeii TaxID=2045452 RepID=UPI001F0749C4|nr:hypothetical protein [Nocardioides houyundeii]